MEFTNKEKYQVEIERDSKTGNIIAERWFNEGGQLHRVGGPAVQEFSVESGELIGLTYYKDDSISYREDGLATMSIDPESGVVTYEEWKDGANGDPEAPSTIARNAESGAVTLQIWDANERMHRDGDRPAWLVIDPQTGVVVREEYWFEDNLHREKGPAVIHRDAQTGEVYHVEYHRHGKPDLDAYEELGIPPPD
ncbi:MAG: hypothetical protein RIA09_10100 [Hoeflea sp.]|uniref:hypothetical protein n=1 Tax=Hoeflea sp. TaxID=1940281 RepID=UPI0032ECE9A2